MAILKLLSLLFVFLPFARTADLSCRTPLGVSCHLIQYECSQWVFFERGITDIRHVTWEMTSAVRRDGSSYIENSFQAVRNIGLYLAPTDKVVRIFPATQTYSSREPLIWHDRPYRRSKDGDDTCSTGILHDGTDFHLDSQAQLMLGVKVVHWSRTHANGGSEDIYMAPEIDCAIVKRRLIYNNEFHLPRFINTQEATRIERGEPSTSLFVIPGTFRLVEDPGLPGLLRYLGAP